jgi:hypothetical protein
MRLFPPRQQRTGPQDVLCLRARAFLRHISLNPIDVLCLRARAFLRHISLNPIDVARQPVGSGYRALDPAGFMVLSEVETSLALIMGLESSSIPLFSVCGQELFYDISA